MRVAKVLPVKTLVAGTHAPAAISAFIDLTNTPARALDGEKLQLLCHTHLPIATLTYSEDVNRAACKAVSQICGIKVSLIFPLYTRPIMTITGLPIDVVNQKVTM